jgi:hypothetical protein
MDVPALAQRIECDDGRVLELADRLYESVAVVVRFMENGAKRLAAVVVAHHQHDRNA